MLRLVNLIQIESFTKILNQVISNNRTGVVLERLKIPNKFKRLLLVENLLGMFLEC